VNLSPKGKQFVAKRRDVGQAAPHNARGARDLAYTSANSGVVTHRSRGPVNSPHTSPLPPPGWYPDPEQPGQRWWDGTTWGPVAPEPLVRPVAPTSVSIPPQDKSSALALLLTVLWPGGGHLYLGLTQKSIPYVVANAIGTCVAFFSFFLLFPITFLIWLVTLLMTVGSISRDTEAVNYARHHGHRVVG
jgi:hypothetical protein